MNDANLLYRSNSPDLNPRNDLLCIKINLNKKSHHKIPNPKKSSNRSVKPKKGVYTSPSVLELTPPGAEGIKIYNFCNSIAPFPSYKIAKNGQSCRYEKQLKSFLPIGEFPKLLVWYATVNVIVVLTSYSFISLIASSKLITHPEYSEKLTEKS